MIEVYEHLVLLNIMWASVDWNKESITFAVFITSYILCILLFSTCKCQDKEMATFYFFQNLMSPSNFFLAICLFSVLFESKMSSIVKYIIILCVTKKKHRHRSRDVKCENVSLEISQRWYSLLCLMSPFFTSIVSVC